MQQNLQNKKESGTDFHKFWPKLLTKISEWPKEGHQQL